MPRYIDMTGQKFGLLRVLRRAGNDERRYKGLKPNKRFNKGAAKWLCRCECGNEVVVRGQHLREGRRKSCGIGHQYRNPARPAFDALTYSSWAGMHERCLNPKHSNFPHCGGRGIKICDEWYYFVNFAKDMGVRPSREHSIERIDVNGDYEPGNCRWATNDEQARNKTNTVFVMYQGRKIKLIDLAEELGLSRSIVYQRLKLGWSLREALALPVRAKRKTLHPPPVP